MFPITFRRPERLVEYFVQVGLQEPLIPLLKEQDRPITDVCVIYDREACPAGFEKLEFTVSGGSGNLNAGGNVFSPAVWLCVSRAPHPIGPITDLTILYLDRDDGGKLPPGYTLIDADLNKGSYGYAIGLCYTRARLTGSHTGPILDIGIVNIAAHDQIPPRYREIGGKRRNVNAGSFRDEMYIIVKHAIRDPLQVKYKPTIIDRYPRTEREGSPMPTSIALFCCPDGIELVQSAHGPPPATYNNFVLTTDHSSEIYCACLTFYECYQGDIPEVLEEDEYDNNTNTHTRAARSGAASPQPSAATFPTAHIRSASSSVTSNLPPGHFLYAPRKLCLLSYWPYFCNFCSWLEELYRHGRSPTRIPLESLILQLFHYTPLPGSGRMRVQLEVGVAGSTNASVASTGVSFLLSALYGHAHIGRVLTFDRPQPDDFPLANLPLTLLFRTLSLANILILLSAVLTERKVILASKVLPLLTYTAETIRTLIFPLKWTHPYIPILPTPLAGMLDAPMPIFVGVSESFIDTRVVSGDDVVLVYLDRDEIKIGGNTRQAYSTASPTHMANHTPNPMMSSHAHASGGVASLPSSSAPSFGTTLTSATLTSTIPEKLPGLTMLPRKFVTRLVAELRNHTNVLRIRKFRDLIEVHQYFHCFRGTTRAEVEDPIDLTLIGPDEQPTHPPTTPTQNLLAIRACFMHIFITLLQGMDGYLVMPSYSKGSPPSLAQLFDSATWLDRMEAKSRTFARCLLGTQMFSYFVEEKTDCQDPSRAIELAFFAHAQKYDAQLNASMQTARKMSNSIASATPQLEVVTYLSQQGSNYSTYTVPTLEEIEAKTAAALASSTVATPSSLSASHKSGFIFSYAEFPRKFDIERIREPTPQPIVAPDEPDVSSIDHPTGTTSQSTATASSSSSSSSSSSASLSSTSETLSGPSTSTDASTSSSQRLDRSSSVESDPDGGVLYSPVRPHAKSASADQLTNTVQAMHITSSESSITRHDSYSIGANATDSASSSFASAASQATRHIKSYSSDYAPSSQPPANGTAASQPLPRSSSSSTILPTRPMAAPMNNGQSGTRMFTGQRGPTAVFRPAAATATVAQPAPQPEKKDRFERFIDFLTTVKRPAPPTPQRSTPSAPSTPQRVVQPGQSRVAPNSAQRAPPSAHRTQMNVPGTGPRPAAQPNGAYANGTPDGRMSMAMRTSSSMQRSSSMTRTMESPMRQPNFGPPPTTTTTAQLQQMNQPPARFGAPIKGTPVTNRRTSQYSDNIHIESPTPVSTTDLSLAFRQTQRNGSSYQ